MVRPEMDRWGQTLEDLRQWALEAEHRRTRERFLALYMIASGSANATQWAEKIGRRLDTVLGWVHGYNQQGPEALVYHRSGGRAPFLRTPRRRKSSAPRRTASLSSRG